MASTSSINSSSSGSQPPNPPPRTLSRPNQPPPPPPLPTMPPVTGGAGVPMPPTRDSSIAAATNHITNATTPVQAGFLSQFGPLFKQLEDLPTPDPFMNKPKSYPSQRAQQKHQQHHHHQQQQQQQSSATNNNNKMQAY